MATRERCIVLSGRLTEEEAVRVGLAARLRGTTRSSYVREAAVKAAEADLDRIASERKAGDR